MSKNGIYPDYYKGPVGETPTNPFNNFEKDQKQKASYLGNNSYLLSIN